MSAELTMDNHPSNGCVVCDAYLRHRGDVLPEAVIASARRRGLRPSDLFLEYMQGVHRRHQAGLTLAVS